MSSAWSPLTSSAATAHGTGPLLQSTAVANIIFINIDWKRNRHINLKSTRKNLSLLASTTSSIVTNMKPAVICCCEAGTAAAPMTMDEMSAMAHAMGAAWKEAATERTAISFLFEADAPYLTIWDDNRCKCTHGRILKNVYHVPGHRRTAQAFLCTMPGEGDEEGIDVVNVHAPSGTPRLTDTQRFQLIRNLLQSSSMTRANRPIGEGRFLIGGDMNTDEIPLGQILDKLKGQGILKTNIEVMVPLNGLHGDICVVGGFTTTMVQPNKARNHDPQHVPYGIAWRKQPEHAAEQLTTTPPPQTQIPTAPDTTTESSATGATAAAVPTGRAPKQMQPDPQMVAVHHERQLSQLPLEEVSASAWPATEQPDELSDIVTAQHRTDAGVVRTQADAEITHHTRSEVSGHDVLEGPVEDDDRIELPLKKAARWGSSSSAPVTSSATRGSGSLDEDLQAADEQVQRRLVEEAEAVRGSDSRGRATDVVEGSPPPTQKGPDHTGTTKPQIEESGDADTGTTRHATEQSPPDEDEVPELNEPGQEMAYVIVNAFLDNVTFESTEAERLIKRVILKTGEVIRPNMLLNIDEVFRPIFFYYPNGLDDRTRARPLNASQYIRQWRAIATW